MATRKRTSSKKQAFYQSKIFWNIVLIFSILFTIYIYRNNILYYLSYKSDKILKTEKQYKERNLLVLNTNEDNVFGIDVSHYQGTINWEKVNYIYEEKYPIKFVLIRATQGIDKNDNQFKYNWLATRQNHFIRGAYHYYRPNENSIEQANNFIKNVKLSNGDLPPILDIERLPNNQSVDNLKIGLKRFLKKVENHYKVKPIIYSGEKYYEDFLKDEFAEYTFWIANYNFIEPEINSDYQFWQFTEQAKIDGITEKTDVNIFNGNLEDLKKLRVK